MKRIVTILLALCALGSGAEARRPPLPLGVMHGLAVYRWLDGAMLGALLPSDTPNTSKAYTWTAMQTMTASPTSLTLTGVPTGTTSTTSTLVVNPASATANADLVWAGIAGTAVFVVDEDGDVGVHYGTPSYALDVNGTINARTGVIRIKQQTFVSWTADDAALSFGSVSAAHHNDEIYFNAGGATQMKLEDSAELTMGRGALAQDDVTAHLDQDCVTIRRDIDLTAGGGGPYNEAGALLHLHRDVTNGGTINGNFMEWSDDGANELGSIDKLGGISARGSDFGDGGTTNYAAFAADGTLSLHGTARTSMHRSIANANFGKGNTKPDQVIAGNFTGWSYGIGDDSVITMELPHDCDTSADIEVHITWYIDEGDNTKDVQWEVKWSAVPHDGTEAVDAPTHTDTIDSGDIAINAVAKRVVYNNLGSIPAGSIVDHDTIGITFKRVVLDGGAGANPTAEPVVLSLHLEYVCDGLGE